MKHRLWTHIGKIIVELPDELEYTERLRILNAVRSSINEEA
jgi:hypothetical protein